MSSLVGAFLVFIALVVILIILVVLLRQAEESQKQYGTKAITSNGETVRSIAEKKIADYFNQNNIKYVYEKAIYSFDYRRLRISYPDFFLPDYNVYVEYWGLVDADDEWTREKYIRRMKRKMAIYHSNNIKFISIYPRNLNNLDWIFRAKFKQATGIELVN